MIEVILGNNKKMMAMVMGNLIYGNDKYIVYCIDREKDEVNIFVSKLIISSEGYTFSDNFNNGEKEMLDGVVLRIINKEDIEKDGFKFNNDIELRDVNHLDIDKCYVATINKRVIKEVMVYYNLVTKEVFESPVVGVVEDKRIFNEGFLGSLVIVLFGISVIVISVMAIVGVFE